MNKHVHKVQTHTPTTPSVSRPTIFESACSSNCPAVLFYFAVIYLFIYVSHNYVLFVLSPVSRMYM